MANIFSDDFRDFILALNKANVAYILVGGYSVILHGYQRSTGDLDLWVKPTQQNFLKLQKAFYSFGLPTDAISLSMFMDTENYDVFTFGRQPVAIDIMTVVKGLAFDDSFKQAQWHKVDESVKVKVIHLQDLIATKSAVRRYRDLEDILHLTRAIESEE